MIDARTTFPFDFCIVLADWLVLIFNNIPVLRFTGLLRLAKVRGVTSPKLKAHANQVTCSPRKAVSQRMPWGLGKRGGEETLTKDTLP